MTEYPNRGDLCCRCSKREVEVIEGYGDCETYVSPQCSSCNDRDIDHSRERAEWDYYHPKRS